MRLENLNQKKDLQDIEKLQEILRNVSKGQLEKIAEAKDYQIVKQKKLPIIDENSPSSKA